MAKKVDQRRATAIQLQKEIQANRERFVRRMVVQAVPETTRLRRAYANIISDLKLEKTVLDLLATVKPLDADRDNARQASARFAETIAKDLKAMEPQIIQSATTLQSAGASAGYQIGLSNLNAGGVSARFNQPSLEAIRSSIEYVDSQAFQDAVAKFAPYHAEKVGDFIISGVSAGKNPREIARLISGYFTQSQAPLQDALRMARTTQLYAARNGLSQTYARNGVEKWIWVCSLDLRTCGGCWAMHGTIHPVTETCNDHHNGRCTQAPLTPRWADLGLDGQDVIVASGENLFNRLPDEQQKTILGPRFWEAYQAGQFEFSDLSVTYNNPIFGDMRRKATLQELLQ